jgi:hypothetical protein
LNIKFYKLKLNLRFYTCITALKKHVFPRLCKPLTLGLLRGFGIIFCIIASNGFLIKLCWLTRVRIALGIEFSTCVKFYPKSQIPNEMNDPKCIVMHIFL